MASVGAEWAPWDILVGVDESELHEIRLAKAELNLAVEVAGARRDAFNALVKRAYEARSRQGDLSQIAEAAGLSTAQVKRLASGQTSGNQRKGKA